MFSFFYRKYNSYNQWAVCIVYPNYYLTEGGYIKINLGKITYEFQPRKVNAHQFDDLEICVMVS